MEKMVVIINEAPGSMKAWNALRIAEGLLSQQVEVAVFLLDNGVFVAKAGQAPMEGLKELNLADKVSRLADLGVKVNVCQTCANQKGLKTEELAPGSRISNLVELAQAIKESRQTLVF
ncbi:MAG: DsrE family protein [Candidatus Schekmanbacteria bacterium]|nr:DsrE family protein [Candidatus Schekmanbacteria bacterium]